MNHYDIEWKEAGKRGIGYNPKMTTEWSAELEKGWRCKCEMLIDSEQNVDGRYMLLFANDDENFILGEEEVERCRNAKDLREAKMRKWNGVLCKYTEINQKVLEFLEGING